MVRLGEATWPELAAGVGLILVPVGSCEQHGPHLPLDTDTRVARAVSEAAARRVGGALVAPAVTIGASGEHAGFPGTLSVGTPVLTEVLVEIGRSAGTTATAVMFCNGHGGNLDAVVAARRLLVGEGRRVGVHGLAVPDGDAHAGRTETSLMLAVAPDLVRLDRLEPGVTAPLGEIWPRLRSDGLASVTPNGVLGDPRGANRDEGERLLAALVDGLVAACASLGS